MRLFSSASNADTYPYTSVLTIMWLGQQGCLHCVHANFVSWSHL